MKKWLLSIAAVVLSLSMSLSTFGATGTIVNGKTMVPVRGVFEQLGFQVYWEGSTGTAYIVDDDISIEITKGESIFYVNGSTVYPDVPQQVIGGSLYIPLRAIADSIGADISWNAEDKMAHISYEGNDVYVNCKPQEVSLQSQVPSYYIYPAGEYSARGYRFSVNMYSSYDDDGSVGVIYTNDSNSNRGYMYNVGTNIYKISGGTLNGCRIGFTSNKMIVTGNSSLNGNYAKTATYEMP